MSSNDSNVSLYTIPSFGNYKKLKEKDTFEIDDDFLLKFQSNDSNYSWDITLTHTNSVNISKNITQYQALYNIQNLKEGPLYLKNTPIIVEKIYGAIMSKQLVIIYSFFFCVSVIIVGIVLVQNTCDNNLQMPDEKALIHNDEEESDSDYDQPYPTNTKYVPQTYFSHISRIPSQRSAISISTISNRK